VVQAGLDDHADLGGGQVGGDLQEDRRRVFSARRRQPAQQVVQRGPTLQGAQPGVLGEETLTVT
jgi:hypothetical protein